MNKKYLFGTLLISLAAVAGVVVSCSPAGRSVSSRREVPPIFETEGVILPEEPDLEAAAPQADTVPPAPVPPALDSLPSADSLPVELPVRDSIAALDSTLLARVDSLGMPTADSSVTAPLADTASRPGRSKPFLEAPVVGKANDSLVYDVRRRLIFHYDRGELTYEDNNLKADRIIVNADTKEIYGTGALDTAGVMSRPEFIQGGANYTMDTVRYNLDTRKALVQGVATKDGEGFMLGRRMKKMPDNSINIEGAKYTTCDRVDHPHFYIAMTKAKTIPGKKIITGPAYFVMEDVPLPLGIPGGFFPISTGPTDGLVMPTYGEESQRGFYLRGGGYYFTFGDHFDLRLTGDIYTLGSWGLNAASNYIKRYKFRGSFNATYNNLVVGDGPDRSKSNTFSIGWNHTQDPKASLNQTFSANVNFSTSGQKQMATTSLQDHLNTNTSSSISYSRRWTVGTTTVSLNTSFNLNANSRDTSLNITLPNLTLGVSSFAPFKRKNAAGKQRWYEKITMSYTMNAQNSTGTVKEYDLFTKKTLQGLQNGITHNIPVQTSFNLLNYINFSPSFNYRESWNFKRQRRGWDPDGGNGTGAPTNTMNPDRPGYVEPEFGFFRSYGWNVSGSFSTKIYGQFNVVRKPGKTGWLQAFRHVITPTVSFSYAPDFRHPRYGMWENVQSSASGAYTGYNPNIGYGVISPAGPNASVNFSVANQLELKVKSRRDSTDMKKIKVIEQLSLGSSYNFLAPGDSMHLATFPVSLRTGEIFKGFAIQLSGTWDPYQYVNVGNNSVKRIGKFAIGKGKFGRITQTSWSFGKTFSSSNAAGVDPSSMQGQYVNPYAPDPYDLSNGLDPASRRQYMVQGWYDFSVPWSFTFNYNVSYRNTGIRPEITQTLGFNGSVTMQKWGFTFQSGYDFTRRKLSHMQLNLTRDLHCWEMTFGWVPMGRIKSYSFHIGIKSGMLRDIKYDKSSNMYDNMMR